jgi:hypothetical protein
MNTILLGVFLWFAACGLLLVAQPGWALRLGACWQAWRLARRRPCHKGRRARPGRPVHWTEPLHEGARHAAAVLAAWLVTSAEAAPEKPEAAESLGAGGEADEGPLGLGRRIWLKLTGIGAALVVPARRVPWIAVGLICLILAAWYLLRGVQPHPAGAEPKGRGLRHRPGVRPAGRRAGPRPARHR